VSGRPLLEARCAVGSGARAEEATLIDQSVRHEKAAAAIRNGKLPARRPDNTWGGPSTGLSDDEVREQVRARLAESRLPTVAGVSQSHRGTGRPCIVCRRAIEPTEVEREVTGCSGVPLTAHEACYKPWREESRVWRDLIAVGEAADRSGRTDGDRT
jgi:hypothetical protein